MNKERKAFLKAIEEDPIDMVIRGVFADWLDDHDEPELATFHREMTVDKYTAAKELLEELADECCGTDYDSADGYRTVSYEEIISAMEGHLADDEEWLHLHGQDTPGMMYERKDEIWDAFHVVTARVVPENRRVSFISCSC